MDLDNTPIDKGLKALINRISFNKTRDIMSELQIDLTCPLVEDNSKTKYILSKGREVVLFGGWGTETFLGAGIIHKYRLDVAGQRLTVIARDKGRDMAVKQEDETYNNTRDSDIARTIAGKYGVQTDIEDTPAKVSRVQSKLTDFEFLRDLAARNGYEFYFEFDVYKRKWVMHFHSPRSIGQKQTFVYDYSASPSPVSSFSPEVSGEVEHKAQIKMIAFLAEERGPIMLEAEVAGDATVREVISGLRFQNGKEAKVFFDGLVKQRNETYMTAQAIVLGNEKLKIGEIHQFKGITPKFFPSLDGNYRINEYTHNIISGEDFVFTTELDLYRVS
jgi:hypothetical protein